MPRDISKTRIGKVIANMPSLHDIGVLKDEQSSKAPSREKINEDRMRGGHKDMRPSTFLHSISSKRSAENRRMF